MLFYNAVTQLGTTLSDVAIDITVDPNGQIFLAGNTKGSLSGQNQGDWDIWFANYNENLEQVWVQQIGTSAVDRLKGIISDSNGDLYLTGYTFGNLGGTNSGGADVWLAKYNTAGEQVWLLQPSGDGSLNSSRDDEANDIFVDADGNIYLTGNRTTSNSDTNVWLAKYNSNGDAEPTLDWSKSFGGNANDVVHALTIDNQGNVYIAGYTEGVIANGNTSFGSLDAFIAKYDSSGNQVWLTQFGTPQREEIKDIIADADGNIYVTGYTSGSLGASNLGQWDAFIAKYNGDGQQEWIAQRGTVSNDDAYGLVISDTGNVFVTGRTVGTLNNEDLLDRIGGSDDIWIAEYSNTGDLITDENGAFSIRQYGSNGSDLPSAIALTTDPASNDGVVNYNLLVVGSTYGTLGSQPNSGLNDGFLLKFTTEDREVEVPTDDQQDVELGLAKITFDRDNYKVSQGEKFKIPIRIEDAIGVRGIDFEITFDTELFAFNFEKLNEYLELGSIIQAFGTADLLTSWTVNIIPTATGLKVNMFNNVEDFPPPQDGGQPLPQPPNQDKLDGELAIFYLNVISDSDQVDPNPITLKNILVNEFSRSNATTQVEIIPDILQVQNIEPQNNDYIINQKDVFANGVNLQMSRSINLDVLNLYSTFVGNTNEIDERPDVVVTDQNGNQIKGSLVWDDQNDILSFIKFDSRFAPGTYTITLEGNNPVLFDEGDPGDPFDNKPIQGGVITPLGSHIDGDINGEEGPSFVGQFTVPNYEKILIIDDISRGPGQNLEFIDENTVTAPMGISISDIRDLTKIEFTLKYDTDILDSDQIELELSSNLASSNPNQGWNLTTNNQVNGQIGQIDVILESKNGQPLTSTGETDLVLINASVRNDASYGTSHLLDLESIVFNDGDFTGAVGVDKGFHQVSYLGDVNGYVLNDSLQKVWYTSGDPALIAQVGIGSLMGFPEFPLIAPEIIGDVTKEEGITAFDAAIVAREASGLFDEPLIPNLTSVEDILG